MLELESPGPGRRTAPCPAYDECGGCRLQHLDPVEQRRSKRSLVEEALRRIGGLDVSVPDLVSAGGEFGYRNRVTFSTDLREGRGAAGYRAVDDAGMVVDIRECRLAEAPIQHVWEALRRLAMADEGEPAWCAGGRITVRGSVDGEVDVLFHDARPFSVEELESLMGRVPALVGCHFTSEGGEPVRLAGRETLRDRWQGCDFDLPADVFLQVNRVVSAAMDAWIDERVGDRSGQRVLDLYSGVGARAIRWAVAGADVVACEISRRAAAACRRAGAIAGSRLEVRAAAVERELGSLLPADLVVVNPPRTGLSRAVAEGLSAAAAARLLYVSCDPATLARDLLRLKNVWSVSDIQPFDAFPQTAHVETAVLLVRQ